MELLTQTVSLGKSIMHPPSRVRYTIYETRVITSRRHYQLDLTTWLNESQVNQFLRGDSIPPVMCVIASGRYATQIWNLF